MNYGPLIFLAAFFALASSWFGLVLTPQLQVGRLQQTNTIGTPITYPVARPGLAHEGLDVYRANGCAYCHSQQVGQSGIMCKIVLTDAGTNQAALVEALCNTNIFSSPMLDLREAKEMLTGLPKDVQQGMTRQAANEAAKALKSSGAKSELWIVPEGPDIARGWGKRRTIAYDYLYDSPVMLGSQRVGPDLSNVGLGKPDANWHLLHLYAPRLEVKDSSMPPYRFLFEKRKIQRLPSPDALALPAELAPPSGYEIVPTQQATALASYLVSLRADAPLFESPLTAAAPAAETNAPATGAANAPTK